MKLSSVIVAGAPAAIVAFRQLPHASRGESSLRPPGAQGES